ncbi:glycosyl hydrolase-related protein [Paenibacillus sp. TRM 82003]|nr:glycosyl hydrolase-related protein [Paenibacillus sp. TRM 82003]
MTTSKIKKVIIVCKTHFDIGFTDVPSAVVEGYATRMLPDVVETCLRAEPAGEGRPFVWTMPAWPLQASLDSPHVDPDVRRQAEALIREGRIRWHGLPFTTHTEFCGLEELIRGLYLSKTLAKRFGVPTPISAKMTDVPGHTRMLPTLLAKAGIRFLHLGCNPFSTPPDVPLLFQWEGPDGARVITFYNKGSYGSSLQPPADWPFPAWLALMNTGDNHGPQTPERLAEIVKEAREALPGAEVVFGGLDDFAAELMRGRDKLPVVRGELADSWIHGVGTYPVEVSRLRALRHELADAEKALSLQGRLGQLEPEAAEASRAAVNESFERGLMFGEHTWGLDMKQLGEDRRYDDASFPADRLTEPYRKAERSWEEQRAYVRDAETAYRRAASGVYDRMAAHVSLEGPRLLAFNGSGCSRSGWTAVPEGAAPLLADGWRPATASGEPVAVRRAADGVWSFYADRVPGLGYAAYPLREPSSSSRSHCDPWAAAMVDEPPLRCDVGAATLENRWHRVVLDAASGTIRHIRDHATSWDWVAPEGGFGRYEYDVYGDEDITEFMRSYAYRFYTWGVIDFGRAGYPSLGRSTHRAGTGFTLSDESDEHTAVLVMCAPLPAAVGRRFGNGEHLEVRVSLDRFGPGIDFEMRLTGKRESPLVEAGHAVFPFRLPGGSFAVQKLGQVVRPNTDIVDRANHMLHSADAYVELSDGIRGMAVVPIDAPLVSFGRKGILQYDKKAPVSIDTTLFGNLFNNAWGTNFPQWLGGDYRFRYRFVPFAGEAGQAAVAQQALHRLAPLRGGFAVDGVQLAGAPSICDWLYIPEGMEVLCLKQAEEGEGWILRLHDLLGRRRRMIVRCKEPLARVEGCDILEGLHVIMVTGSREFGFETLPFEVHTFRIVFA